MGTHLRNMATIHPANDRTIPQRLTGGLSIRTPTVTPPPPLQRTRHGTTALRGASLGIKYSNPP